MTNRPLPQYPVAGTSSTADCGPAHHTGIPRFASQKSARFILNQLEESGWIAAVPAIYVHIPFCFHKCHYCDFYSIVDNQDRQAVFVDRLIEEIEVYGKWLRDRPTGALPVLSRGISDQRAVLDSIFIGGGTPTLLKVPLWKELLVALRGSFPIGISTEFTVEANPETLTAELAATLVEGGVNRLSVGAQSFQLEHLKTLERWHEPASVGRAFGLARAAGIENLSLDLIFGIPGQTPSEWQRDLETALALEPTHLSCYALTYEPNTALTKRRDTGAVEPIDDGVETEMFLATREILDGAGFEAYEISNFARQDDGSVDYRCRHNLTYWRGGHWLGIGPAAAGHLGGYRYRNVPHLQTYLASGAGFDTSVDGNGGSDTSAKLSAEAAESGFGFPPVEDVECAAPETRLAERILMGLRLAEGLNLDELLVAGNDLGERRGAGLREAIRHEVEDTGRLVVGGPENGEEPRLITLTVNEGLLFADTVIGNLMDAIEGE